LLLVGIIVNSQVLVDKQGRVSVKKDIKDKYFLDGKVYVVGFYDAIRFYNIKEYNKKKKLSR